MPADKHQPYGLTSPCRDCPFRRDIPAYIRAARVVEIERGLVRGEFHCHKTTGPEDDEGDRIETGKEMHCAGALILLEKIGRPSQMMRICERVGLYDPSKLDLSAPVYKSFAAMFRAARRAETRKQ